MMVRLLLADWLKIKHTWVMWLVFIGPIGLVLCQVINYGLRYDYLIGDSWHGENGLFVWIQGLLPMTVMLGSAIIAAMMSSMEHDTAAFKQLFALPVSKIQAYVSKVIWIVIFLGVSTLLSICLHAVFGIIADFPDSVPWSDLSKFFLYPYLAAFPFFALQLWLSLVIKNQALPIICGVLGAMFSSMLANSDQVLLHWLPWSYPSRVLFVFNEQAEQWVYAGLIVGLILLIITAIHFSTREVK